MKILGNICIAMGVYLVASMFNLGILPVLENPFFIVVGFIGSMAIFSGIILRIEQGLLHSLFLIFSIK